MSRHLQPVATAGYNPCQAARSYRVASATSAVMLCVLPLCLRLRAGATVQPTQHHRFLLACDCWSSQCQRLGTALAKQHQAVALAEQVSRPCSAASRCALCHRNIAAPVQLVDLGFQSVVKAAYRPAQAPRMLSSAAVARRFMVLHSRCGHTLRFYIRPYFRKCPAVAALKLHLVPVTAARPHGFPK